MSTDPIHAATTAETVPALLGHLRDQIRRCRDREPRVARDRRETILTLLAALDVALERLELKADRLPLDRRELVEIDRCRQKLTRLSTLWMGPGADRLVEAHA